MYEQIIRRSSLSLSLGLVLSFLLKLKQININFSTNLMFLNEKGGRNVYFVRFLEKEQTLRQVFFFFHNGTNYRDNILLIKISF